MRVSEDADQVEDAFRRVRPMGLLTSRTPAIDEATGYAIAAEIHRRRRAEGAVVVGRKIGFTNRTIWATYGVWDPIWAYVYDRTTTAWTTAEPEVTIGGLSEPRIEPEIQLCFAQAPPPGGDEEAILACAEWVALGFELVQSPFADWNFRAPDAIAACSLHGHLVLGAPVTVNDPAACAAALREFDVILVCDGAQRATGRGSNVLDSPVLAVRHLMSVLAEQNAAPIAAGEIISTGTLTDALPVRPRERWSAHAHGIDLASPSLRLLA
jgi:2-oxo-3-hexenedioate decarboxylase